MGVRRLAKATTLAAATALAVGLPAAAEEAPRHLSLASTFPVSMSLIGESPVRLAEKVARASGGALRLDFHGPGELAPAARTLHAVSEGTVDVGWGGAGWFTEVDTAFNMFSAVPFGPRMGEYMAWLYHGGGLEMARTMFAQYNLHNIPCALIPPEASGWFRKEIRSVEDLRGLRMRFFGLGARVMQKLGVDTRLMAPGEIRAALEAGTLDATEFSLPVMDQKLGFHRVMKFYYFPGWHQQATLFDLYVNLDVWRALPDKHKAILELACGDMIRDTIAEGEALQWKAMRAMQAEGVEIRRWPVEIIAAMESAWNEVVTEEAAKNENFRRVYESYDTFRRDYAIWQEHGYLK